jgi:hypothetical protein
MVPSQHHDEGYEEGFEGGRDGRVHEEGEGEGCCWHHCGLEMGMEGWVVCCGGACAHTLPTSPITSEDIGAHEMVREDEKDRIEEVEVKEEMEGGRMLCRDEWGCDFCGLECFCWTVGVEAGA